MVSISDMHTEKQSSEDVGGGKKILRMWSAETGELIGPALIRDGTVKSLDLSGGASRFHCQQAGRWSRCGDRD